MKYRKKPVIVEAMKLGEDRQLVLACLDFMYGKRLKGRELYDAVDKHFRKGGLLLETPEGEILANYGDYIIKGIKGEIYHRKPDIFEQTYTKVLD